MTKTKKLILLSLLIAQALALHIIERIIPIPLPIPGVKLGLANIITLLAIIFLDYKSAVIIVVGRTFLASLFGGGPSTFLFSLVGSLASMIMMTLMYKRFFKYFSIPTISIVGAVFHNIGQIAVASLIVQNINLFYYLPILIISGIITGLFIGLTVNFALRPLRSIFN